MGLLVVGTAPAPSNIFPLCVQRCTMPSKKQSPSHPYLSPQVLEKLSNYLGPRYLFSRIHSPDIEVYRSNLIQHNTSLEAEVILMPPSSVTGELREHYAAVHRFGRGHQKTNLHFAAHYGDIPFAHECINLGIKIDCKDKYGETPLLTACKMFEFHMSGPDLNLLPPRLLQDIGLDVPAGYDHGKTKSYVIREFVGVAELLIMQHADVNVVVEGQSPLLLACRVQHLPLVKLLLDYGADPRAHGSAHLSSFFRNSAARSRFVDLVNAHSRPASRPPRPCPCWSGQLLQDCHAAGEQLYPAYFLCRCGSSKTYGACCRKRIVISQVWDAEKDLIMTKVTTCGTAIHVQDPLLAPTLLALILHAQTYHRKEPVYSPAIEAAFKHHKAMIGQTLIEQSRADPAFVYSMQALPFVPLGFHRRFSRILCRSLAEDWNNAVDAYIAQGSDAGRHSQEISMHAKIGDNGGALYTRCEADGCTVCTNDNSLQWCSRCKTVLYCSARCQKAHWAEHRKVCKQRVATVSQKYIQLLPSQSAVKEELSRVTHESLRRIRDMGDIKQAFAGSCMDLGGVFLTMDFETGKELSQNPRM
ncbi:ankyrin [Obba rivulosa]|uniref:Ankyrin n=1 Tax=Obba rivulosa TaxID=1052685 RepID=A0A8E2DRP5_9APHY|nr:ankyrin [Obba rivulosa]